MDHSDYKKKKKIENFKRWLSYNVISNGSKLSQESGTY